MCQVTWVLKGREQPAKDQWTESTRDGQDGVHSPLDLSHLVGLSWVHVQRLDCRCENDTKARSHRQDIEIVKIWHEANNCTIQSSKEITQQNDASHSQTTGQMLHNKDLDQQIVDAIQHNYRGDISKSLAEMALNIVEVNGTTSSVNRVADEHEKRKASVLLRRNDPKLEEPAIRIPRSQNSSWVLKVQHWNKSCFLNLVDVAAISKVDDSIWLASTASNLHSQKMMEIAVQIVQSVYLAYISRTKSRTPKQHQTAVSFCPLHRHFIRPTLTASNFCKCLVADFPDFREILQSSKISSLSN